MRAADPTARLAGLLLDSARHRDAVREFSLAGYATMVEQHKAKLRLVYEQIREHCREHGLELPPGVPER